VVFSMSLIAFASFKEKSLTKDSKYDVALGENGLNSGNFAWLSAMSQVIST